jgi:glutathione S-transferase
VHPYYYAAVVKGESNGGPALIESINTYIEPLLSSESTFVLGDKFGLAEILCAPFVVRIYLIAKIGLLGEGIDEKFSEARGWDKWARGIFANENVRKTFDYEFEARKVINRVRKIREANKHSVNGPRA